MPRPDGPNRIDQVDAKAGSREGVVRWVLLISLGLTILAFAVIVISGALSQDPVESQQNAHRRAQEQRELAEPSGESQDLAEESGLVAPGTTEKPGAPAARETGVAPNAD